MQHLTTLRQRLINWTRGSDEHRMIVRGIVWTAFFVFLGKLISAAKEIAVAWRYGVGEQVDAYLFVFNLATWPVSIWAGVLPIVLVPLVARLKQHPRGELLQFRAELCGLTILLSGALAFLTWAGIQWLLRSPWSGLPAATLDIALSIATPMTLLSPLGFLTGLFAAWMLATGRYANTLYESLPALAIFLTLVFVATGDVAPLVWGTVAGFAVHLLCAVASLAIHKQIERPVFALSSVHWRVFWQAIGVMLAGQALMSMNLLVDQFFAANLHVGAVSTLSYANRILALVIALGVTAVSRATLPVFAKAHAQNAPELQRLAAHWTRLLFLAGVAAIAVGWWLAPVIVKLLFERGAFSPSDTAAVVSAFRHGLFQLPFYFAGIVVLSLLSARSKYRSLAFVSGVCLGVKIGGNFILVPLAGVEGIQWSTALMYSFYFLALWVLATKTDASKPGHNSGTSTPPRQDPEE